MGYCKKIGDDAGAVNYDDNELEDVIVGRWYYVTELYYPK